MSRIFITSIFPQNHKVPLTLTEQVQCAHLICAVFSRVSVAPHVEFVKPLQDVEVKEKESAKFECEVSRESAKASQSFGVSLLHKDFVLVCLTLCLSCRFAGSRMALKLGKGRSMRSSAKEPRGS